MEVPCRAIYIVLTGIRRYEAEGVGSNCGLSFSAQFRTGDTREENNIPDLDSIPRGWIPLTTFHSNNRAICRRRRLPVTPLKVIVDEGGWRTRTVAPPTPWATRTRARACCCCAVLPAAPIPALTRRRAWAERRQQQQQRQRAGAALLILVGVAAAAVVAVRRHRWAQC
jgi:hypothetical protein